MVNSFLTGCFFLLLTPGIWSHSLLLRHSLQSYNLALCSDGSPAAYFADSQGAEALSDGNVLIYLADSPGSESAFAGSCSEIEDCFKACSASPDRCRTPSLASIVRSGGLWSRNESVNPFANYFKVLLPSCSLDEFSGTRGPLDWRGTSRPANSLIYFHGRHIFNALLRDLVAKFRIDRAHQLVLIGSGASARGAARSCDFLSDAMATVSPHIRVKCVLDGPPDFLPYWIQEDPSTLSRCTAKHKVPILKQEEWRRSLWGRADDESCVRAHQDHTNASSLAQTCGVLATFWRHISTPYFLISAQFDVSAFQEISCAVQTGDPDFQDYQSAWRRGVVRLTEAINRQQPENGFFVPNCGSFISAVFMDDRHALQRRVVRVPVLSTGQHLGLFQVLRNWLLEGGHSEQHVAVDPLGIFNPSCTNLRSFKSQNLDLRPDLIRRTNIGVNAFQTILAPLDQHALLGPGQLDFDSLALPDPPDSRVHLDKEVGPWSLDQLDVRDGRRIDQRIRQLAASVDLDEGNTVADREAYYRRYALSRRGALPSTARFAAPADLLGGIDLPAGADGAPFPHSSAIGPDIVRDDPDEAAGGLSQVSSRKARLWSRLYYMQYLRDLYRRAFKEYYLDYFYGKTGQLEQLVDSDKPATV